MDVRRRTTVGAVVLATRCVGTDRDSETGADDADESTEPNTTPGAGEVNQMGDLTLTSPEFDDGERIPERYGYDADNVNPSLEIDGVPDDAVTLALLVDDPDAMEPAGKIWDHWIVWNVPPETTTVPEDWRPDDANQGTNDFGERGYGGPSPPDREHTYRFACFALETTLDLGSDAGGDDLRSAMDGHIVAQTQLEGTYPTD